MGDFERERRKSGSKPSVGRLGKKSEYSTISVIGSGSCGTCKLVRSKRDDVEFVMKKIDIARCFPADRRNAYQEAKLLQKLRHPCVVAYHDAFVHKNRDLCIVIEHCEGGDLHTRIRKQKKEPLKETQIWDWFGQLVLALHYLHKRKIIHRDIKPSNVFLTKELGVKLGDFGVSKVLEHADGFAKTTVGTPYYMSPEIVSSKPYSYKSDCWSLGCVLYEMATLSRPFEAKDMEELKVKVCQGRWNPDSIPAHYSPELKETISNLLIVDQKQRPKPVQLLRLPQVLSRVCVYFGGYSIPRPRSAAGSRPLTASRDDRRAAIRECLQRVASETVIPQSALVEDLQGAEEHCKADLKLQLRAAQEAAMLQAGTDKPKDGWKQVQQLETDLEIQELVLQLLSLLLKWSAEPEKAQIQFIEDNEPPEVPILSRPPSAVPILSRPPSARMRQNGSAPEVDDPLFEKTVVLGREENDRAQPVSKVPQAVPWLKVAPHQGANLQNVISAMQAVQNTSDGPSPRAWRVAGPRPGVKSVKASKEQHISTMRSDSTDSDRDTSPLPSDRGGMPTALLCHRERLASLVEVPPSPGVLGQLIKEFDDAIDLGAAGPAVPHHALQSRVPQSPLKALLKQHFGPEDDVVKKQPYTAR